MTGAFELGAEIAAAAEAVRDGEVVGLPTETVYGIGVDPALPDATRRIFEVKKRPESVAIPLLIAEPADAALFAELDDRASGLIERYWPGPLTLVLPRLPQVDFHLGGDATTVGLRCPAQPTALALLAECGPLAVTSANRHGEAPARTAAELRSSLGRGVRVVVDGGRCEGKPSTVLSLIGREPTVLREGALSFSELFPEL